MAELSEGPMRRWAAALEAAARGERVAQVVWVGDSISELNQGALPLPWQVGDLLAGRTEPTQYRSATTDAYAPGLRTDGRALEGGEAGLGGRAIELTPGQTASVDAGGEGVTVVWRRRPGGGAIAVRWGERDLDTIETDGPDLGTGVTALARTGTDEVAEVELRCTGAPVHLAGVYVHHHNLHQGVRVWPAVRSGNKSAWFVEHPGWLVEPLAALAPDLVVLATGTNDDDYEREISALIRTVREHAPDAAVALWLPPINQQFTVERAATGRTVARREGCTVIDAAGELGELPTLDGVHPTALTVSLSSFHAASHLGPARAELWWSALVEANRSLALGQRWGGEIGVIEVQLPVGLATLMGKVRADDAGAAWVLALPPLSTSAAGIDGAVLGMGPGGGDHPDTFLSRLRPGGFAVNGGQGSIEVERLVLRSPGADGDEVVLVAADDAGGPGVVALHRGHRVPLTDPPTGLDVPLPCAVGAHLHPTVPWTPEPGATVWVPMPALARPVVATAVWLEVLQPADGVRATAGVALAGPAGRPGAARGWTPSGAVDCGAAGVVGAALEEPVPIGAGVAWWVGLHVGPGAERVVVSAATVLRGGAGAQVVEPGVAPSAQPATGAFVVRDADGLPRDASGASASLLGPAPALQVSLEEPSRGPHP